MATCPNCAEQNPDGARFCHACGAALAAAPAREVRKTVTVLFADVTGSTTLGEQLDPESFRRVMARYFEAARGSIEGHGGTVEKFVGDAVMAVFGVPSVHEDDALRALRAAAELRDSLASLNEELERDYGVSLQLRTGVNTGEVVTGTKERLATGDAVNVAARLEEAAQPGEILIGEQTRRLSRGAIEVEPVKPLALKGKRASVPAHRLLRVVHGASAFDRQLDAPLVGRQGELAQVHAAFEETVSERRCRLVTVLGPAGIGKSRLAREAGAALSSEAAVFAGRCLPYGEGITYWALVEIFREAGAEEELAAALSAAAPEEVFWAVRKALEHRARDRPLVLVIEDIHWAEPTLLDLVEHLVDWTRDAPLLLLCLARPEILDERPAWGGRPDVTTLTLEPLADGETDELIEELVGGSRLEDATSARIRQVAEGNPLFVEQLLALLAEEGELEQVPPTIQALLAARLETLPDEERDLVERASVVGLEFEWEALGELTPNRQRPPGARLAALVRKELIRPHEVLEDTFRFRHVLIRDAAYERIPKDLRSELHERFADWLDGRGEEFDEIVGYHVEQAYRSLVELRPLDDRARTLAERAAERLSTSGRRAYARGDMPAAANLLERAAGLMSLEDARRLDLLPSLGRALIEAGEWDSADALLSQAVALARGARERGIAADAAVALCYLRLHAPPLKSHEEVERELEDAIHVFEELQDKAGLARALGLTGLMRHWRGEAAAATTDLERAARYAREAGDRAQETESLRGVLVSATFGPTPVESCLKRLEDIRREVKGNRRSEVSILAMRALLEAMGGRFEPARGSIAEAKVLAEELGLKMILAASVLNVAGQIELLAGDPAAAERELRPACEMLERIGDMGHFGTAAPYLADALYAQGRGDEAMALIELASTYEVEDDLDAQAGWRRVLAKVLAQHADFEEAERLAREATALAARTDFLYLRAHVSADLAEVLRLRGRAQESAAALEEAIRLHERKGNVAAASSLRSLLPEPHVEV